MSKIQDLVDTSTGVTKDEASDANKEGYLIEGSIPPPPIDVCIDYKNCEHWRKLAGPDNYKCAIKGCGRNKFKI
jgi:hypothetical protein